MSRGGTHKRVSLGLHPVSLRKSKEMGWNGQDQRGLLPKKTAHTCKAKDKAASSLCFLRVRRYVGRWLMACPAFRPHFFGACPKKRCRAAKEKRFFYLGGSTIRVSASASVIVTHLRPTWGRGWCGAGAGSLSGLGVTAPPGRSYRPWRRRPGGRRGRRCRSAGRRRRDPPGRCRCSGAEGARRRRGQSRARPAGSARRP